MNEESIRILMNSKKWYMKWEILPGILTPGFLDINPVGTIGSLNLPEDISNWNVIDIGTWDGAYAFELEKKGAAVTALDIHNPNNSGFNTAKFLLKSKIEYIKGTVYDMGDDLKEKFDFVFYQGIFYHLLHPLLAFEKIWNILKPDGLMYIGGLGLDSIKVKNDNQGPFSDDPDFLRKVSEQPMCYFVEDSIFGDKSIWFIPTVKCLKDWLSATGFKDINIDIWHDISTIHGYARKDADFKGLEHLAI